MNQTRTNNHQQQIFKLFNQATENIQVAVSWFTDELLIETLAQMANEKKIEVLLSGDELNLLRHRHFKNLQSKGAIVRKAGSDSAIDGNFMHSKLIIVDGEIAYGGSYNFTENARTNMETFKKYAPEELCDLKNDFNKWMEASQDFFDGVDNADAVVKRIKQRFMEDERKRTVMLNSISKQLTERDEIIEQEIKKDKLRTTVDDVRKGELKVTETGALKNDKEGVTSKPHRFYGGDLLTKFDGDKKKTCHAVAVIQKKEIELKYKFLKCKIKNDTLICKGLISTEGCNTYRVRIEYRAGNFPQVYIVEPRIIPNGEIHIYKEGCLCLFYPGDMRWKDSTSIAEHTIPWIYEWIIYYELYLLTGKWEGEYVEHRTQNFKASYLRKKEAA